MENEKPARTCDHDDQPQGTTYITTVFCE